MLKLVIGMRNNRGFTLIEILVVIVIVSIALTFAIIAFGDFGESRRMLFSAEQLAHNIELAQQKAILEASTFGLKIDNRGYQIIRYQNDTQWQPISNRGIFKYTSFPKGTVIYLKTDAKTSNGAPNILINAAGDMTPFTIEFKNNKNESLTLLTGSYDGNLNFSSAKNE